MPQGDDSNDRLMDVSRRRYAQAIVGAGLAGIAGCSEDGTDGATPTATEGDGDGGTPTATMGDGTETATEREPVRSAIRQVVNNVPEQSNYNDWGNTVNGEGMRWQTEIISPTFIPQNSHFLNGHTYATPHHPDFDEVSVAMVLDDFEAEPPYTVRNYLRGHDDQDPLTFWDGEPITAEAYEISDAIYYYDGGGKFNEASTFNTEATSEFVLERWNNKGEVPDQQPDPTNAEILVFNHKLDTQEGPWHPKWLGPYRQQFEDASSQDAVTAVSEELAGDTVTINRWAEEELGSGLYATDPESVSAESLTMTMREDHPNAEHATIPEIEMQFAANDRWPVLAEQGQIDAWGAIVQTGGGRFNRSMLPDHIQEIDRWLQNAGDALLFNWNSPHVRNLWVRRAIVSVIDWESVGANGWGAERSFPAENQVGIPDNTAEGKFSSDFLDSIHTWDPEARPDQAADYMQRAGYTRQGGVWTDPDGNEVALRFVGNSGISDWTGAAQTIQSNLQNFGMRINYNGLNWSSYTEALRPQNLNYDIAIKWYGQVEPWQYYWAQAAWWGDWLYGGDPTAETSNERYQLEPDSDAQYCTKGRPRNVYVPDEPGDISAPDEAGMEPQLSNGSEHDMIELVHSLRDPGLGEEEYQQRIQTCARMYNYYLPDFEFHNYTWGLTGNVRDFDFPPGDNDAVRTQKEFSTHHFNILAGTIQASYDEEFTPPGE